MFGLNNYMKRRKLEIDIEVQNYRESSFKEIENLALACARDKGNYEHEYHHSIEILKVDIAKLEALKETMKNDITNYEKCLNEKDKEIERLQSICIELAKSKNVTIQK
jgi:hypothetical protein